MLYALFHTQFLGHVAIPSSMLDKLLQCAYLIETAYPTQGNSLYTLIKASPLASQRFRSVTAPHMRELAGYRHSSRDAYVVVMEYGKAFAVPAKMISQVVNRCYLFEMSYVGENLEPSVHKLGNYTVKNVQPLSNISFETHSLADIKACQSQGILSGST